jgi:hypothetical protein
MKCAVDPDCSSSCEWSLTCEPHTYGYSGLVFPASLFREYWGNSPYSHWPRWKWDWKKFLPTSETYQTYLAAPVHVFVPEASFSSLFKNTMDTTVESYPEVEFQKWKSTGFQLRTEGCRNKVAGSLGADCVGYPEFASLEFVRKGIFVSLPHFQTLDNMGNPSPAAECSSLPVYLPCIARKSSSPPAPSITTQRHLGLRYQFEESWQLNVLVKKGTSTANHDDDMFYPLYWKVSGQSLHHLLYGPDLHNLRDMGR